MAPVDRDFLAFADRSRDLLAGCALLLVGDPARADRLATSVLARRGVRPMPAADRWAAAWAELVRPRASYFDPPWSPGGRVELLDTRDSHDPGLLTDLQRLAPEPRAALVLDQYAGLPAAEVAAALQTSAATVELWVRQATETLAEGRPERRRSGQLGEELRATVDAHLHQRPASVSALTDLAHARQLARRRRLRSAAAVVAAVLVLVLGTVTVLRAGTAAPEAGALPSAPVPPALTPVPSASHSGVVTARCDIRDPSCQATVMREWRTTMARVTASHLDPEGRYFTDYRYSYDGRYETPSFWKGGDGALGLEVYRPKKGTTEVYLQIATGYDRAVTCGRTTGQTCESQRFMDGNRFTLSDGTQLTDGIEVQYRPDGDQVITVVAQRSAPGGESLDVTRGDLINLVQDPRLRLPVI
ncbi:sigma factor-like helix-turn-helix DNA-binding protein [uncultured Friedmanniella sp.]|uniref:sigma factor-like helix-turn-helix DNA-binding protein n=1 Tax=uncultured Friedmanniella sp. TaxID=335381 RepID=UPI0035CC1FD5